MEIEYTGGDIVNSENLNRYLRNKIVLFLFTFHELFF